MVSEEARCFAHVFLGVQNIRYSQEVFGCLGDGNKITKHTLSKKTCFFLQWLIPKNPDPSRSSRIDGQSHPQNRIIGEIPFFKTYLDP